MKRYTVLGLVLLPLSVVAAQTGARAPVRIIYKDFSFTAPTTLPAGYTTFQAVNQGAELHNATLIRLEGGKTAKDFVAGVKQGVAPSWAKPLGGLQNSGTVGYTLVPGQYIWWCFLPGKDGVPHAMKGMWQGFEVTAVKSPPVPPKADIEITIKDGGYVTTKLLTSGRHVIKVVNDPGQAREFMVIQLKPGKNTNDFLGWIEKQAGPAPHVSIQGIPSMAPGEVGYVTFNLQPGRYTIVSFAPDARDGRSQLMHGLVREIVVR